MAFSLILLAMILLSLFLYRAYRISSIPVIGDPFDVAEFETIAIPDSENAALIYVSADSIRAAGKIPSEDLDRVFENGWGVSTEALQKLLTANERALDEWRRGTERPSAQFVLAKDVSINPDLSVVINMREFSRLARLRSERCLHEGDVSEAWNWLRAGFRASRHLGKNGPMIERTNGFFNFKIVAGGINRWAADPRVDELLLRQAAEQFNADDAMTPLTSVTMKYEYVSSLHMVNSDKSLSELRILPSGDRDPASFQYSYLFVMGDREYSRRLLPHVFDNWLEQVDFPRTKRAPIHRTWLGLYSRTPKLGQLSTQELESRLSSICLARILTAGIPLAVEIADREAAQRAALKLTLATQRFHRLHGDWPKKLDDLVPDLLQELPLDPFGKAGESLILKRDGDEALIYSVGENAIDDGGDFKEIMDTALPTLDEGFRLKRPQSPSAEK